MLRTLAALSTLAAVSCTATDEPPRAVGADSPMVVATDSVVPSDGRPTVAFLGTSLTAGYGLARERDGYVAVLEQMADSVGTPFRAINAGVSGDTSAGGLRRLDWVLGSEIDVLVVELGANDGLRGQDPAVLRDNLTEIVRRSRARYPGVEIVIAGMEAPPNLGPEYTAAFRAIFPEVASAEGVHLIPFLLDGVAGVPELNQSDRIHPTVEGHRRVAETVWPILREVLAATTQGTP